MFDVCDVFDTRAHHLARYKLTFERVGQSSTLSTPPLPGFDEKLLNVLFQRECLLSDRAVERAMRFLRRAVAPPGKRAAI